REAGPEQPAETDVVDQDAGESERRATADPDHRGQQSDGHGHPRARQLVANDPDGQRHDRRPRALDRAAGEDQDERAGDRGEGAAGGEDAEGDEQRPRLAVHVPEPAEDRRRDRGAEKERRQQPRRGGGRHAVLVLEGRQRRQDHRLLQREGERRERERGDRPRRVRASDLELLQRSPSQSRNAVPASETTWRAESSTEKSSPMTPAPYLAR